MNPLRPVFVIVATGLAWCHCRAATISYLENFNSYALGDTTPTNFTESGGTTTITDTGGIKGYTMQIGGNSSAYSSINLGNPSPLDFEASIDFRMDALSATSGGGQTINQSLVVLATTSNLSTASSYRMSFVTAPGAGILNAGKLVLAETSTTGLTGTLTSTTEHYITSTGDGSPLYTLRLSGTYSGGSIILTGGLYEGSTLLLSVNGTDASPVAGTYYGVRFASNSTSNFGTVTYDNFNVATVPEPAILGLFSIGSIALLGRRKNR